MPLARCIVSTHRSAAVPALFPPAARGVGLLVGKELTALDASHARGATSVRVHYRRGKSQR